MEAQTKAQHVLRKARLSHARPRYCRGADLGFVLRADHNGLGYGPGVDMAVSARLSSASTFGETDFDTDDLKTPSVIEDISYRATARCPSKAHNQQT